MKTIEATLFKVTGNRGEIHVERDGVYEFKQEKDYPFKYKYVAKFGTQRVLERREFNNVSLDFLGNPCFEIDANKSISCEVFITKEELPNKDAILERVFIQLRIRAKMALEYW